MKMAQPFLAEIRIMSFGFPPKGWALCNGQLLPINQNQALYSLLKTTFGGDGSVNFALPNLQGRAAIHMSNSYALGKPGGERAHTLAISEVPTHVHALSGTSSDGDATEPIYHLLADATPNNFYAPGSGGLVAMSIGSLATTGGSQAHLNMQPFLALNFCIALQGNFPSQN
jgi:microcystin-dependent protein